MAVEQPMVVLRRSIRGLDDMLGVIYAESSHTAEERAKANGKSNGHASRNGKGKAELSERLIVQLGWTVINEA